MRQNDNNEGRANKTNIKEWGLDINGECQNKKLCTDITFYFML